MKLLLSQFFLSFDVQQDLLRALQFRAIQSFLFAFDFAEEVLFDAIREIFCHLRLGSPQEEGTHARREPPSSKGIALGIVEFRKLSAAPQNARHGKSHEAPQISK